VDRIGTIKIRYAVYFVAICVFWLLTFGMISANALDGDSSSNLPNNGQSSGGVSSIRPWLVVTGPGSNGMRSPYNKTRVYVPSNLSTFQLTIEDACETGVDNSITNADTYYSILGGNDSVSSGQYSYSSQLDAFKCIGGANLTLSTTITTQNKITINNVEYKILTVFVQKTNPTLTGYGTYYVNRFRFNTGTAGVLLGYAAVNNDAGQQQSSEDDITSHYTGIAYDYKSANAWGWGTKLAFAPSCNGSENLNRSVYFYDTDYNSSNENTDPEWQTPNNKMFWKLERFDRVTDAPDTVYNNSASSTGYLIGRQNVPENIGNKVFDRNYKYVISISNINVKNSLQVALPYDQVYANDRCGATAMTCSGLNITFNGGTEQYTQITFNIKNNTTFDWTASGNTYDIGVIDTSFAGSKLNGNGTMMPRAGTGGNGPPDHLSDPYIEDNKNGSNAVWHREAYNRDVSGPLNQLIDRYGTTATVSSGNSTNFSVWVKAPSINGSTKEYGIRMLSRDARFAPYAWMDWDESCKFSVKAVESESTSIVCSVPKKAVAVGQEFYLEVLLNNTGSTDVNIPATATANYILSLDDETKKTGTGRPYDTNTNTYLNFPVSVLAGGSVSIWSVAPALTVDSAGSYDVKWDIAIAPGINAGGDCGAIIKDAVKGSTIPYVKFFGNDVIAGGGFGDCKSSSIVADVKSYGIFNPSRNQAGYKGSSSELAVFASGQIDGVLPGSQDTSRLLTTALSFSNENNSGGTFDFGGQFDGNLCIGDFWTDTLYEPLTGLIDDRIPSNNSAQKVDLNSLSSGSYSYGLGSVSQLHVGSSGLIPPGRKITIYVNGDVVIGSTTAANYDYKVAYDTSRNWGGIDQIPLIKIVSKGNIYIDDNVSQFDGLLVAVEDSENLNPTGEVHTCSLFSAGINIVGNETAITRDCNHRLEINGAVIAKKIRLLRSNGNLQSAVNAPEPYSSANIAEVFRFSPELYLAMLSSRSTENMGKFDSVLSLPPAL
jgi:hypothetical protein